MRRKDIVLASLLGVSTIATAAAAAPAAAQARETTRRYDIEGQPLGQALNSFAEQSGLQIMFDPALVRGKQSAALHGNFNARSGLERLISRSGLRLSRGEGNVWMVKAAGLGEGPAGGAAAELARAGGESSFREVDAATHTEADSQQGVSEILIVGQRPTLNADIRRSEDASQPYVVIGRKEIERSGATNAEDLLRRLTTSESSTLRGEQQADLSGTASRIDLRGLGAAQTLILIDGRRIASRNMSGEANQPDINAIPLMAIDRIEILPTTASGIYGGGATGGVVNIVLRRDYRGLEAKASYGGTTRGGAENYRLDLGGGLNLNGGRTNILVSASYAHEDDLNQGDRPFFQRYRDHLRKTNPASIFNVSPPPLGVTSNIRSANGASLILKPLYGGVNLGSSFTSVPKGYAGPGSDNAAGLVARAGTYNLDFPETAQINGDFAEVCWRGSDVKSASATVRHAFSDDLEVFGEASFSENQGFYYHSRGSRASYTLTAANPGNPFNQTVVVTVPAVGADFKRRFEARDWKMVAGAKFSLPYGWRAAADYTWNRNRNFTTSGRVPNGQDLVDARSGALNLFADVNLRSPDFSAYVQSLNTHGPARTTANIAALRLGGPLPVSLPGGKPAVSIIAENRDEKLGPYISELATGPQVHLARSQQVRSLYGELLLPIVGETSAIPGVRLLEVSVAGRADWYAVNTGNLVFGSEPPARVKRSFASVNPTVSARWKPIEPLMVRASFGTGFLPPSLAYFVPQAPFDFFLGVNDPRRGNELIGQVSIQSGGNPDLRPEKSTSWSAGIVVTPDFIPGFRFSADWVRISKRNNIDFPFGFGLQSDFDLLASVLPQRIIRSTDRSTFGSFPVGPVVGIDISAANIARARFEAIDFAVDQKFDTSRLGRFDIKLRATRQISNRFRVTPAAAIVNRNGEIGAVRWRGSGSLNWEMGAVAATYSVRFIGPYRVPAALVADQGSHTVPAQSYHDLLLSYTFPAETGPLANMELQLMVKNLFDKLAPLDVLSPTIGAYSTLGDVRGRGFQVSLRKSF